MAIIGRFAVNLSYNIGLQYAAELLPTVVRAQGVALIHIMGYVASIVAPFVVYLVSEYKLDTKPIFIKFISFQGKIRCFSTVVHSRLDWNHRRVAFTLST